MDAYHIIKIIVQVLLIAGGLNWLATAAFNRDLVNEFSNAIGLTQASQYIKILVGLAAIAEVFFLYHWLSGEHGEVYNALPPQNL